MPQLECSFISQAYAVVISILLIFIFAKYYIVKRFLNVNDMRTGFIKTITSDISAAEQALHATSANNSIKLEEVRSNINQKQMDGMLQMREKYERMSRYIREKYIQNVTAVQAQNIDFTLSGDEDKLSLMLYDKFQ